jgi:L-2-hydroxycarboxylate dehydrogenase (NAD+)
LRTTAAEACAVGIRALTAAGVPESAAHIQVQILVEAELRGHHSHGMLRLPRVIDRIAAGVTNPTAIGEHTWTAEALLSVDGQHGLGPVIAVAALDEIATRVDRTGIACAAIHSSDHLGMMSWYVERMARRGMVAVGTTTSEALVHPWGGRFAMQGTNPLAIAVPADPEPLVLDMSTGLISMGKVHDYAYRGKPLEPGWALDPAGEPTTDADKAKTGAIAPFGGAKGYALGLALEVLVATLTASALGTAVRGTLDSVNPSNKGDVFIVIKAGESVLGAVSAYLAEVRQSAPRYANQPILVPGDRARNRRRDAATEGFDVTDEVWQRLLTMAS